MKEKQRMIARFSSEIVLFVISIALSAVLASSVSAFQITIDPGEYSGGYSVAGLPLVNSATTIELSPGTYIIDTVPGVSGFTFTVDAMGQVTGISNPVAAQADGNTLVFNTAVFAVDPQDYPEPYYVHTGLSGHPHTGPQGGFVAVRGLLNHVDTIPGVAGVNFFLDAMGQVTGISNPVAAQADGNTFTFANVNVHVDPTTYTLTYTVSNYGNLSGPADLVLVPGLLWLVGAASQGGSIIPYPDQVIPPVLTLMIEGESHRFVFTVGMKPIANAGPDQTVDEGAIVTLDGSQSSVPPGGSILYGWRQLAGPLVTLDHSDPAHPIFHVPEVSNGGAILTFELVITNGQLTSDPDTVDITVKNVNNAPVADAGASQTVQEESIVVLDGSHSFDPDSDNLVYHWVQISGPPAALSDLMAIQPSFTTPLVGPQGEELIFHLTVNDGEASDTAETKVIVENINHTPSANAGMDQTVNEGSLVILDGTMSSDPDNDPLTYTWFQLHGTPVQISDPHMASLAFTAPPQPSHSQETLVFRLEVNDEEGSTASDEVAITVLDVNALPECDLAQASPDLLWPPNHKLISVRILSVMDPNNDQVTLTVIGVTQDEPVEGLDDGNSSPDAVIQGDTALLRAERAGSGNGRVYQVHFMANDGHGGSCTGTATVCVPHNRQTGACVDGGQQYDATQP